MRQNVDETCEILSEVLGTGGRRNPSVTECHRIQRVHRKCEGTASSGSLKTHTADDNFEMVWNLVLSGGAEQSIGNIIWKYLKIQILYLTEQSMLPLQIESLSVAKGSVGFILWESHATHIRTLGTDY